MNKTILVGNLTRDPESRMTTSGISVCNFTLAVERRHKDAQGNKQVDFIDIVIWRQLADLCGKYLAKGSKVAVVGSIVVGAYTGNDGIKRQTTHVVADEVEFLTPKAQGDAGGHNMPAQPTREARQQTNFVGREQPVELDDPVPPEYPGFTRVDDDGLPF